MLSIVAPEQRSRSTVVEIALCYIIVNMTGGPTLWLDQTGDDGKAQSESELQKPLDKSPPGEGPYPANPDEKRTATIHFRKQGITP